MTVVSIVSVDLNKINKAEVKRSMVESFNQVYRIWTSELMDTPENLPFERELGKLLDHFQECIDLLDQGE